MPSRFSRRQLSEIGRLFFSFLAENEGAGETDRERLRILYNQNFKPSQDTPVPTFSSMLYGLRTSNQARVTKENVIFRKKKNKIKLPPRPAAENRPLGIERPGGKKAVSLLKQIFENRHELIKPKYGVDVELLEKKTVEVCDGRLYIRIQLHQEEKLTLQLQNRGTQPVSLTRLFVFSCGSQISFQILDDNKPLPLVLHPNDSHRLQVHCQTDHMGHFPATVLWKLAGPGAEFSIARFLALKAQSPLTQQLGPTSPYRPCQLLPDPPRNARVEEGEKPNSTVENHLERTLSLGQYDCSHLKHLVPALLKSDSSTDNPELLRIRSQLNAPLSWGNYGKLKLLLQLEELRRQRDIKQYHLKDTTMSTEPQPSGWPYLLTLKVPGLAENRPSVLRGDKVLVTLSRMRENPETVYKGYVHKVELDQVKLSFHQSLLKYVVDRLTFDVDFTLNRLLLRIQYRAMELARKESLKPLLFPDAPRRVPLISEDLKLTLFNRCLESNPQQAQAIRNIILGTSRPAPYLIFGPPGTGKTVTLVEAIKQVVKLMPDAHILACAPTNWAANLLCQRLLPHLSRKVYRLVAESHDFRFLPEDIKDHCNWDKNRKGYIYPSKKTLQEYRVLITTLFTAGRLASAEFPRGHFSHIFIDEAGQASEPESLIAVAGLLDVEDSDNPGGQLVLAGDPKQLGPVLHSPLARNHGLGMSLLERLMEKAPQYKRGPEGYDPTLITKLLCNYRSHPSILEIPNRLFYQGELLPYADLMDRERFCHWEGLPRQGFPIVFHGVLGEETREANSPSFFNAEEASTVVEYLHELLCSQPKKGQARLSPQHVGVISPCRKQVQKICHCLTVVDKKLQSLNNIKDLKVGSVEEFQGQERSVIIISTVRSSQNFVPLAKDFNLGFLSDPKRFNVAVTRAKALLIVVGNPILLSQDRQWKTFLQFCKENGGYKGCPFPSDEEPGSFQQLTELGRSSPTEDNPPAKESIALLQEELAWRREM
ncbi:helicase MOV-10 [Tachyglossus aculeatus]|uniref:helicase MOV-10 n=1 Tax=Tachyglossus aculeatus TaxID=9261 RepID=UPI0018F6327A|nr:helicase MOV-10 [Tachyglossus aculeatus]